MNKIYRNSIRPEEIVHGDKPYGSYWEEIEESDLPIPEPVKIIPSLEEQLQAVRKALIEKDETDLIEVDRVIKAGGKDKVIEVAEAEDSEIIRP